MSAYTDYKETGIEWLGQIPSSWNCIRLKFLVSEKLKYGANEAAESDDLNNPRYIRITDFGSNGILRDDTFKSLPEEIAEPYLLLEGDILFARSGATVGKTFQFKNYDGKACYAGYLIKATFEKDIVDPDFIYFFTKSSSYENWKNSVIQQATIENIGADKYNNIYISIPSSAEEQTQIAHYLDHKTAQIDKLITDKEKLIELLNEERTAIISHAVTRGLNPEAPMKDCGIDWLGKVPREWKISRLKHLGTIKYGLGQPPKQKEGGFPIIRATNIERGKISTKDLVFVDPDDVPWGRDPALRENDIIVVRSGAYTGDSAIIPKEFEGAITGYDMVFRSLSADPQFIAFALLSRYILENQLFVERLRAAQPHLNAEELGNILVLEPGREEQANIVEFVRKEHKRVDKLIATTRQEIQLLKEYKTARISEVVTGKVDVRNESMVKREALANAE